MAGGISQIENHIFDLAYDGMIPSEFSFNYLMDAKHKVELNLVETNVKIQDYKGIIELSGESSNICLIKVIKPY